MASSEKFRIDNKRKDDLTHKVGGIVIGDRPCKQCMHEHTILTCEMYRGTIPDRILQNDGKCRYQTRV